MNHLRIVEIRLLVQTGTVAFEPEHYRAVWFGEVYTFNAGELVCWQALWRNFLAGNLPFPQSSILAAWRGHSQRVADLFKRNPAWKRVVVSDRRGNYWMRIPPDWASYVQENTDAESQNHQSRESVSAP